MVKKGGSLRSMIGMVGLTEGSSDLNVIDAWINKLEKCESEDVTSSDHCLSPEYKGADCDPTAGGSSGEAEKEEPAKEEAEEEPAKEEAEKEEPAKEEAEKEEPAKEEAEKEEPAGTKEEAEKEEPAKEEAEKEEPAKRKHKRKSLLEVRHLLNASLFRMVKQHTLVLYPMGLLQVKYTRVVKNLLACLGWHQVSLDLKLASW